MFHNYSFTQNESRNFRLMALKLLVLIYGFLLYCRGKKERDQKENERNILTFLRTFCLVGIVSACKVSSYN